MLRAKCGIYLLVLSLVTLIGCETNGESAMGVSAVDVADDPGAYYGSRVTVSGEVGEVYSPGTFTIGGGDFGEEVLVMSADSIGVVPERTAEEPLRRGDVVQVSGTVRPFVEIDLTDHYGFEPSVLSPDYEDRPVIIARSAGARLGPVIVTPRNGGPAEGPAAQPVTDFDQVADEGRTLAGRTTRLSGVTSSSVVGDNGFWATTDSDSLFVVMVEGALEDAAAVDSGQTWQLWGVLREVPPPSEIAAAWDVGETAVQRLSDEDVYLEAILARRMNE